MKKLFSFPCLGKALSKYFKSYKKIHLSLILIVGILCFITIKSAPYPVLKRTSEVVYSDGTYALIKKDEKKIVTYDLYSSGGALIDNGHYINGELKSMNKVNPDLGSFSSGYYRDLFLGILFVLIVWYLVFYAIDDYITLRDFIVNRNKMPISYMSDKDRSNLLKDKLVCVTCNISMKISVEEYQEGMHFVSLKCISCNSFTERIRVD